MEQEVRTAEVVRPLPLPEGPRRGETASDNFGGTALARLAEVQSNAMAAQAKAYVEARFIVALKRPRNEDDVRVKLLAAIERPGFAGKDGAKQEWGQAWYTLPYADGAEGFTIRFAEEAARLMGNVDVDSFPIYESEDIRTVKVIVVDLETNVGYTATETLAKTVERSKLRKGEDAIAQRRNSRGEITYIVPATEADMTAKQNRAVSKHMRNGIIRIIPGGLKHACRARIKEIRQGAVAKDPEAFKLNLVEKFASLNILPSDLEKYIGHTLNRCSPVELEELRTLYEVIRDGDVTIDDAIRAREVAREEEAAGGAPAANGAAPTEAKTDPLQETKAAIAAKAEERAKKKAERDAAKAPAAPAGQQPLVPEREPGGEG